MSTAPQPDGLAPLDIIRLTDAGVEMLDQTLLPGEESVLVCAAWPAVVDAIRRLSIRGAPALGIAGAMGVALAAASVRHAPEADARAEIAHAAEALRAARPTAVNLAWAVDAQMRLADAHPGPPDALAAHWPTPRAGCTTRRWSAVAASAPTRSPCSAAARGS